MTSDESTDRAAINATTPDHAMTSKEKTDAFISFLGTIFSWPVLTLIIVFMIRDELPGMADRLLEGPFGIKLAAIEQTLATNTDQLQTVAEQVDRIEQDLVEFRPSPDLTQALQTELETTLNGFSEYLTGVGFHLPTEGVEILVSAGSGSNAWYMPDQNLIQIGSALAHDPDAALHVYAAYQLTSGLPSHNTDPGRLNSTSTGINFGLSDYYACSFTNDPYLAELSAPAAFDKPYLRNLDNSHSFDSADATPTSGYAAMDMGQIWGGAFWEMRELLGQERTDRLLFSAWTSDEQPALDRLEPADFVQRILTALAADGGPDMTGQVREIFERRGISLPA